jgi:hypothetical protein
MDNLQIDLEADSLEVAPAPATDSPALASVAALVTEWDTAQTKKAKAEADAKAAQEIILNIERERLPAAMADAGIKSFKTKTGRSVTIETVANASIPAQSTIDKAKGEMRTALMARRAAAYAYIGNNWPGLIKTELSLAFPKGEAGLASRIAQLIRDQFALAPEIAETVHPSTLNSHFKELRDQGKLGAVPADLFGLYIGPIAKIK